MMVSNEQLIALVLLAIFLLLVWMSRVRRVSSYSAFVKEKKVKHAMDGVFIPVSDHVIITEKGQRVDAKKSTYNQVEVGDLITVEVFSNGVHMLKDRTAPNPA
jgi:hypothetical protein